MDGCWPQLHGNLTPAHSDGCAAQCFEGVQRGSLIILSVHPRPQAATPVSRPGFVAHLFGRGPVLRTCNRLLGAPADRLHTDRSYPSALCCAGGLPPGFLCQGAIQGTTWKGGNTQRPALNQLRSKFRMEIISFVSSRLRISSSTKE